MQVYFCDFLFVHLYYCEHTHKKSEKENCCEHEIWYHQASHLTTVASGCDVCRYWCLGCTTSLAFAVVHTRSRMQAGAERQPADSEVFTFRAFGSWLLFLALSEALLIHQCSSHGFCEYCGQLGRVCHAISCLATRGSQGVSLRFFPHGPPPPCLGLGLPPISLLFFLPLSLPSPCFPSLPLLCVEPKVWLWPYLPEQLNIATMQTAVCLRFF